MHYFCNWPGLHKLQENSSACFKSLAYRWLNRSKPSAISAASCAVWFWCRVVWWYSKLVVRQHCLSFHIMKVSRSEASLNSASRLAIVLLTLSCFRCCKKCRNNVKFKAGKIPRMGEECERCSTNGISERADLRILTVWIVNSSWSHDLASKSHGETKSKIARRFR